MTQWTLRLSPAGSNALNQLGQLDHKPDITESDLVIPQAKAIMAAADVFQDGYLGLKDKTSSASVLEAIRKFANTQSSRKTLWMQVTVMDGQGPKVESAKNPFLWSQQLLQEPAKTFSLIQKENHPSPEDHQYASGTGIMVSLTKVFSDMARVSKEDPEITLEKMTERIPELAEIYYTSTDVAMMIRKAHQGSGDDQFKAKVFLTEFVRVANTSLRILNESDPVTGQNSQWPLHVRSGFNLLKQLIAEAQRAVSN